MSTLKKAIKFLPLVVFALIIASCGGGDNPTKTAEEFLAAMDKGDISKAKEFVADEKQKSSLDMLNGDESIKGKGYKVKDGSEKVDGETATVAYTLADGSEKTLNMKKVNGAWKVDFNKMDFMGGGAPLDLGTEEEGTVEEGTEADATTEGAAEETTTEEAH